MNPLESVQSLLNQEPGSEYYTPEDVVAAVKRAGLRLDLYPLDGCYGIDTAGAPAFLIFGCHLVNWELTPVLYDGEYKVLTPATSDLETGVWTFVDEPSLPVRISGISIDIYAAAADVLEGVAVASGGDLSSFSGQNGAYSMAGKAGSYAKLATTYRSKQRLMSYQIYRKDMA